MRNGAAVITVRAWAGRLTHICVCVLTLFVVRYFIDHERMTKVRLDSENKTLYTQKRNDLSIEKTKKPDRVYVGLNLNTRYHTRVL